MRLCRFSHNGRSQVGFYDDKFVVPLAAAAAAYGQATHDKLELPAGDSLLDLLPPDGRHFAAAKKIADWAARNDGGVETFAPPPTVSLAPTRWRIERRVGVEPGHVPAAVATLEDTPFYARSIVMTRLLGQPVNAMHETLSLERFRSPWVQAMLPFRMPRRLRRFGLG